MKKPLMWVLQNLFFPGFKVKPRPEWIDLMATYGKVFEFDLYRAGQRISCLSVSNREPAEERGTAILAHPISRRAKFFFKEGSRLKIYLDMSYRVVLFDFNGFGLSDRNDAYYWKDVATVIRGLRDRNSVLPMILHGVSFGAFHMIRAIPELPQGAGVVIENTGNTFYGFWKRWKATQVAAFVLEGLRLRSIRDMNILDGLRSLNRPDLRFLFIACGRDGFAPVAEMQDLASQLSSNPGVEVFPTGRHLTAPEADPVHYRQLIMSLAGSLRWTQGAVGTTQAPPR